MIGRSMLLVLFVLACNDPVLSAEQDALGPEDPNVPRGELHRPGQPCLVCHDDFAIAGTIYHADLTTAYEGATVTLIDAAGSTFQTTANSAGNFIIRKSDWQPVFPIGSYAPADAGPNGGVQGVVVYGDDPSTTSVMNSHIGRDGSCASCHFGSGPTASSPGPVYVKEAQP